VLTFTPFAAFAAAFALAARGTPLARHRAARLGALDHLSPQKLHARAVPRLGGVAIALAFYAPVLLLSLRANAYQSAIYEDPRRIGALLVGAALVLLLGVFDDLKGAWAWQKLIVQVPAAALAWYGGIRIGGTAGAHGFVEFAPALSLVATIAFVVLVVNAINLLDGLDGLASGIALEVLLAGALCAFVRGEPVLVLVCVCLAGAVAGFLLHNFSPATIFMGDSGSMFIGYVLAVAAIWSSQKGATLVGAVLPAVALGLPLLDTALAVFRRVGAGRSILRGDLDHVHHRLLARGWSTRRTVLALYGVGLVFSGFSVLLVFVDGVWIARALLLCAVALAVALARWLGYLGRSAPR
jgi:UDP-GlcNAc:undecaprenyl-phosphate GlcNAc-1-phosphate transferase